MIRSALAGEFLEMRAALLALLLLLPVAGARRDHGRDLRRSMPSGDYEAGRQAGEAAHTAPGLAIAARAVLADAVLRDTPCMACLQRAERLARQAVAADPHHAYGQIWLAVALGYQARITGAGEGAAGAIRPASPRRRWMRRWRTIPTMPLRCRRWAAGISRWCAAAAPSWRAMSMAPREAQALALFDRAVKLAPGNVAVHYQIALSLAGFDADKYRARIVSRTARRRGGKAAHRL